MRGGLREYRISSYILCEGTPLTLVVFCPVGAVGWGRFCFSRDKLAFIDNENDAIFIINKSSENGKPCTIC